MALASAKQLLDELMGRDRDLNQTEKKHDFTWDGPDICKHFLVKFCPHDLFVNTKADLGACSKIHDERLKKEYEKSSRFQRMGYEEDFLRFCQSMLSDVDKRIKRAKQRLALSNSAAAEAQSQPTPKTDQEEKTMVLTEKIHSLLVQVENLGCEGKVEEAQGIMKLCDELVAEREVLRRQTEQMHWIQTAEIAAAQEKQMEVCDVCGAFLIVGDAQQRVDDHLQGKQHVGYARLKQALDELTSTREKERTDRERVREERRRAKDEKSLDEDRHRVRDRETRIKHRSRSRDREARRSHSRGRRGASKRSRSRERMRKDKDRHRRRSRSKERKHRRSRSRESTRRAHRNGSHSPTTKKDKENRKSSSRKHKYENGESRSRGRSSDDLGDHSRGDTP